MPVPREADGSVNPRYRTTEAKRFLGKMLFHDPVPTAPININQGVPLDLPAGTAFGGTVSAATPNLQQIIDAQKQDTSCGTCHLGEAAGKASAQLNFASGGEGSGYTDEKGNFVATAAGGSRSSPRCAAHRSFRATRWSMRCRLWATSSSTPTGSAWSRRPLCSITRRSRRR